MRKREMDKASRKGTSERDLITENRWYSAGRSWG